MHLVVYSWRKHSKNNSKYQEILKKGPFIFSYTSSENCVRDMCEEFKTWVVTNDDVIKKGYFNSLNRFFNWYFCHVYASKSNTPILYLPQYIYIYIYSSETISFFQMEYQKRYNILI